MHARSVIEIADTKGIVPVQLILAGYWASQDRLVAFILNGVTPQSIDLVLDPIVSTLPILIPGVLYIDIRDKARVCEAVQSAEEIFAASRTFRRLTVYYGARQGIVRPVTAAIAELDSRALRQPPASGTDGCGKSQTQPGSPLLGNRPRVVHSKPKMTCQSRHQLASIGVRSAQRSVLDAAKMTGASTDPDNRSRPRASF
ncbi:hypothetical protein M728_000141 [Ensifer sp. WSM1721]|uniref:hypothetical protein n=1 Tax=Ensifer sp. WSM1721 TaxID=1041159 RepID=UPI0004BC094D|nr:hypothetical protein [Ensifer sp. WSM1721]